MPAGEREQVDALGVALEPYQGGELVGGGVAVLGVASGGDGLECRGGGSGKRGGELVGSRHAPSSA